MKNWVKVNVEGIDPTTDEKHNMSFEGSSVCIISLKDGDDEGICAEQCLMGVMDGNGAMAMVKTLTNMCTQLLHRLPPIVASAIMSELFDEMLRKCDSDEEAAVRAYDERRAADELD